MDVVMLVDRFVPEARSAAHLFLDLARGLSGRGHRVSVLTKYPSENLPEGESMPPKREDLDGIIVYRLSSPLGEPRSALMKGVDQMLFSLRVLWKLGFGLRSGAILVYSPPLPLAGVCAVANRLLGRTYVVNLHDLYPRTPVELGYLRSPMLIAMASWLERVVYRRAHSLIVPTPESVDYLTKEMGVPPSRIALVYNWVEIPQESPAGGATFRESMGIGESFVVAYAGLVGVAQDLGAVIAAARLAQNDPELLFLVIGEGPRLAHWKAEAEGLSNLRFVPTLPRERYLDSLRASDVCVLALSQELGSPAIPGKLQSIMSVARPVAAVIPEDSAAARVVRESGCGIVIPPGDGDAFLRVVEDLREDGEFRQKLAVAGQRFAAENFSLMGAVDVFERSLMACGGPDRNVNSGNEA